MCKRDDVCRFFGIIDGEGNGSLFAWEVDGPKVRMSVPTSRKDEAGLTMRDRDR